jgi:hypothetical protein
MTPDEISRGRHLGDGVYASFDGYCVWLAANDHRNKVIALEPDVFVNLAQYVEELREHNRQRIKEKRS